MKLIYSTLPAHSFMCALQSSSHPIEPSLEPNSTKKGYFKFGITLAIMLQHSG
jgi:hypothetical protein